MVVPLDGGSEWGSGVGVGVLPGEPERGEFLDNLGVFGPAGWDLLGQGVAAPEPADPVGELGPERTLRAGPAPEGGWAVDAELPTEVRR